MPPRTPENAGVLAGLTQQAFKNQFAEQNIRIGISQQAEDNINTERQLRAQEASLISGAIGAAQTRRETEEQNDIRNAQRDRELESLEAQRSSSTRLNQARIDQLNREQLPAGEGGTSAALFPGQVRIGAGGRETSGFDVPDNPNRLGSDSFAPGFTSNSIDDNRRIAEAVTDNEGRIDRLSARLKGMRDPGTVARRRNPEASADFDRAKNADLQMVGRLQADNQRLTNPDIFPFFDPDDLPPNPAVLEASELRQIETGILSLQGAKATATFPFKVRGGADSVFLTVKQGEELKKKHDIATGKVLEEPTGFDPKLKSVDLMKLQMDRNRARNARRGIPKSDPTGIKSVSDPRNPPSSSFNNDRSDNTSNDIFNALTK